MGTREGTPVWFELNTADQAGACAFYEAVVGWSCRASPDALHGGYALASAPDGGDVAGVMTPPPGMTGHRGWTVYFAADDADALAARAVEAGGTLHFGPMDIPNVGRFAIIADPQGVVFSVMAGASAEASAAFRPMVGAAGIGHGVWIELATPDPDGALEFYGRLFGWSRQGAMPMGGMGDYVFVGRDEGDRPGAILSSALTGAPARWTWYVQVADIDVAVAAVRDAGGTVVQGPDEIPGGAFSAGIADPQGHAIGLVGPRSKED